jgi:hypothetical protein
LHRLSVIAAGLAIAAALPAAAGADRPDPAAPAGASANWLPTEPWVMNHWLPYDGAALADALGVEFKDLALLIDDGRDVSLAEVARRRGLRPATVLRQLLAPWRGKVAPAQLRVLRQRAALTFSQPHLAHHMFGHVFHVAVLNQSVESLYGVSIADLNRLRRQGASFYELGERNGRSRPQLLAAVTGLLRGTMREAVRTKQAPRAWAKFWLGYQLEQLPHYLAYEPSVGGGAKRASPMLCRLRGSARS